MKKLTSIEAYNLLLKDISDENDLADIKWLNHCLYTADGAERIAKKLNLDSDYAKALGLIHDIGRKINQMNHTIEGYNYLKENGYEEEGRICLTHSFIDNDIYQTAGGRPEILETYKIIKEYLKDKEPNIYDNIIQMCDLFCSEKGYTTIEKRLLDITKRKGVYQNSKSHLEKTFELKERLEKMMGCSLYDLFPEIKEEDLNSQEKDYQELLELVQHPTQDLIVE